MRLGVEKKREQKTYKKRPALEAPDRLVLAENWSGLGSQGVGRAHGLRKLVKLY